MKLSKRESIALELLKEMVKVDYNDVANRAYLLADEFIAISDKYIMENKADNKSGCQESAFDPIFSLDVSVLETSAHTKSVLKVMRIKTIEDLVMLKPSDLANSPYANAVARDELRENLKQKGLKVGMSRYEMCDYSSDPYVQITEDVDGNPMFRPIL